MGYIEKCRPHIHMPRFLVIANLEKCPPTYLTIPWHFSSWNDVAACQYVKQYHFEHLGLHALYSPSLI